MSIEKRVEKLEQELEVTQKEPKFILFIDVEHNGITGEEVEYAPTDEWLEKAKKEAMEKNPGQSKYILYCSDKNYLREIPKGSKRDGVRFVIGKGYVD